jgi:hypothetical protein
MAFRFDCVRKHTYLSASSLRNLARTSAVTSSGRGLLMGGRIRHRARHMLSCGRASRSHWLLALPQFEPRRRPPSTLLASQAFVLGLTAEVPGRATSGLGFLGFYRHSGQKQA